MQALLVCCLLFGAFLTTGTCLQCESCKDGGENCNGTLRDCDEKEDTCFSRAYMLVDHEMTILGSEKGCASSSFCKTGNLELNIGEGVRIRISKNCDILPSVAKLPQLDRTPNGLYCEGCIGLFTNECHEITTACTGSESKCLNMDLTITNFVHVNMKGCANEEVCDYLKRGLNETGLEKNVKLVKANCELPLLAAN